MRQEIVRKEQEAKAEKAQKEKEKHELIQSLECDEMKPKTITPKPNLTPLISPAALIPPKFSLKTIGPVSNMLAIERAKQKVMELKAQKLAQRQQYNSPKTIAQTTPKGSGRVAHAAIAAPQVCIQTI